MSTDKRTPYQIVGPATWELVRAAYLAGDSARAVSERFNVSEAAIRRRATKEHWTKRDYAVALEQQGIELPPKPKPLNVAERFAANYTPPRVAPTDEPHPFADLIAALREANGTVEAHKAASDAAFVEEPAAAAAALERQALAQVRDALAKGKANDAKTLASLAEQMRKRAEEEGPSRDEDDEGEVNGFVSVADREDYIMDMFGKAAMLANCMVFNPTTSPAGFLLLIKRWREINLGEGEEDAEGKARKIAAAHERQLNGDWIENLPEDAKLYMTRRWGEVRNRIDAYGAGYAAMEVTGRD